MKFYHWMTISLLIIFSGVCLAANPSAIVKKNGWYIGFQKGAAHLNLPSFRYGVALAGTTEFYADHSSTLFFPQISVGHYYQNNFLPAVFGKKARWEFFANYMQDNGSKFAPLINTYLYSILGNGQLFFGAHHTHFALQDVSFKNKMQFYQLGFIIHGNQGSSNNSAMVMHPYAGLILQHLRQNYTMFGRQNSVNWTSLDETVNTTKFGATLGNIFKFPFANHFAATVGVHLNLLASISRFTGDQRVFVSGMPDHDKQISVSDNDSQPLGAQAGLALGIFYHAYNGFKVGLVGGYDYLNDLPEIVNPTSGSSKPAHIVNKSGSMSYGVLVFLIPL